MSVSELVLSAADLVDREASLEPRLLGAGALIADEQDWVARRAWEHHRDRLANTIRTLRRRNYSGADNLAASLDSIDALLEPSAGDLVREGFDVAEALEIVDRHTAALHKRMGGKP